MSSSNVANNNFESSLSESNTPLSVWASPSSYVSESGEPLRAANITVAATEPKPFAFQGRAAQLVLQGNSSMPGSDELIDKKIELVEAHTDTKIERLSGKIDVLTATIVNKLDSLKDDIYKSDQYNHDTRWWLISIFVVGVFSLAGLIVSVASLGDARFGQGMNVRDVVQAVIKEQQEIQNRDTTQHQPTQPNDSTNKKPTNK